MKNENLIRFLLGFVTGLAFLYGCFGMYNRVQEKMNDPEYENYQHLDEFPCGLPTSNNPCHKAGER